MLFSHEMDHMPSTPNMNDSLNSLRDRAKRTAAPCMSRELKLNASFAQPHQVFSTMKNPLTFILCFALSCLTLSAAPQLSNVVTSSTDAPLGYWLEVEEIAVHSEGELAGQTTYRLAMHMLNDDDFLSSCSGDADNPMILESTSGGWYNHLPTSAGTPAALNPTRVRVRSLSWRLTVTSRWVPRPPTTTTLNTRQATWTGPTNSREARRLGTTSTRRVTYLAFCGSTFLMSTAMARTAVSQATTTT